MCSKPKVVAPPPPPPAPEPPPPVAPLQAPSPMASPEDEAKKRREGGLSQLRIGNLTGKL